MKKLVIVESPTKAKTIQKFLSGEFVVRSSYGHIRDLPEKRFGVDIKNNFQPQYVVPSRAKKRVVELKKELKNAEIAILATDEDREGESIAWHLKEVLKLGEFQPVKQNNSKNTKKPYQRIVFHEITKPAIEASLKNPRDININLVNAQQARRILDRIVGYKLSPFLWRKITRGLSAGRVQSVAVKLIVEREREIEKFVPQEYWTIKALLLKKGSKKHSEIEALLLKKNGKTLDKFAIKTSTKAQSIVNQLKDKTFVVEKVETKKSSRSPLPPFTTSTLQQEAWQKLRFSAKTTMRLAQELYERGLITYHRTDSLNISSIALENARKFITETFGEKFSTVRKFKTKSKLAQEAHEAIRPTFCNYKIEDVRLKYRILDTKLLALYDLIWRRFLASQMSPAQFKNVTVDIASLNYTFRATGSQLTFEGFLKIYPVSLEERHIPELKKGDTLELKKLLPEKHFTQPPARYTEASIIKVLEKEGIGRPSTYAPILDTIQKRNYVTKNRRGQFEPTEIGVLVNDFLEKHFPEIVDIKFTARMEENLDKIASGKTNWQKVVENFYIPFASHLEQKEKEISKDDTIQKTDQICPKCGSPLVIRWGKYGKFLACSNYPKCKFTAPLESDLPEIMCPKCHQGKIVQKRTKKGKIFYGCSRWPKCDFALWDKPTGEICPKCGSLLIETKKGQIKCSNKDCDFVKN